MTSLDARLLEDWDHTASIQASIYNLTTVVMNIASKARVKPKTMFDFHPFRKKKVQGVNINTGNFNKLRSLGGLIRANK